MSTIKNKTIWLIFISMIILTLFIATTAKAQSACAPSTTSCVNHLINETGFGAVEICQECSVCGVSDGICPERYTDGDNESDTNKTSIVYAIPTEQRPSSPVDLRGVTNSSTYPSGDVACEKLNGTCEAIKEKINFNDSWTPSTKTCSSLITPGHRGYGSKYYLAECSGVKRTAGCQWCNDPDCVAQVEGVAWTVSTNKSIKAHVNVVSNFNYKIYSNTTSSEINGLYKLKSPYGNVKVICTKEDYVPLTKPVYIHEGLNRVDCALKEAYCSPQCTIPNDDGVDVCRSRCQGVNGCFVNQSAAECIGPSSGTQYNASEICERLEPSATVNLEWTDNTKKEMFYTTCCSATPQCGIRSANAINIASNNKIKNLLTKTYKKKLKGELVSLKIIVYQKAK